MGTNAFKLKKKDTVKAKLVTAGTYSFYRDEHATLIKDQAPAANAASFTTLQDCLDACDYKVKCAGENGRVLQTLCWTKDVSRLMEFWHRAL